MIKQRLIIFAIGLALLLLPTIFIKGRIAKASSVSATLIINKSHLADSTINISIIGDSWAHYAGERGLCKALDSLFSEYNIKTHTRNCGVPGAKSKDIYNYLLSSTSSSHPIQDLIESGTNYSILFCGINDQNGQYGMDFYSYHTLKILTALVEAGVTPIYIELPEWNIKKQYSKYGFWRYSCYKMLCGITSKQFDVTATTKLYREALYKQLIQSKLKDKVIFIKWQDIKSDNIWSDDMHLNRTGYHRLAECVVKNLLNTL